MPMENNLDQMIELLQQQKSKNRELLKLRDMMLRCVNQINVVLGDRKKRRSTKPSTRSAQPSVATSASSRKKKTRSRSKLITEMPSNAVRIPGCGGYYFAQGVGVISKRSGNLTLLKPRYPNKKARKTNYIAWQLLDNKGNSIRFGRNKLAERLGMEIESLGV